jgi:hypothetical protein
VPSSGASSTLRALRDDTGDTYVLALVRIGFGLLLLNEAWLATQDLQRAGYFGGHFHQPYLPEWLVPPEGVYWMVLAAQWIAALLVVVGRGARPALLVAAALLVYVMLCDRLWFHHYRHTMAAFSTLLALAPCDRHLVLGRSAIDGPGALWAQHAIRAQVSVMYLTSGGTKLLDPDWRGGLMMRGMIGNFAHLMHGRGVPRELLDALRSPIGASLLAKGAIATELSLAVLLWWPAARRLALWVGLFFHLSISLMTPVKLFTTEMLLVYLLFSTPDARARVLCFDPKRHALAKDAVEGLDWLRRFRLTPQEGAPLVVVARDGTELRGARALAEAAAALPAVFVLWPLLASVAALATAIRRGSPRRAS